MLTPQEILQANEEKPQGWLIDPRTREGKAILGCRAMRVDELKAKLGDLIDPEVFYTKHSLILACASKRIADRAARPIR